MKIELAFEDVPGEIKNAIAHVYIEDQSEADAPALQLSSRQLGPFSIQSVQPTVTLDADFIVPDAAQELSLVVRVKGETLDRQPIEFLNTISTLLPTDSNGFVRVIMSRIV